MEFIKKYKQQLVAVGGGLILVVLLGWLLVSTGPTLITRLLLLTSWGQRLVGQDAAKTVAAVNELIELPLDEVPTLATVSDASKLANQPLFAKAQPGDKVLLYPKNKKAYLYRPATNKLIDVASMSVSE